MKRNIDRLPVLLSVPHAGRKIPPEVSRLCAVPRKQLRASADPDAAEIFRPLGEYVDALVMAQFAPAIVDPNRAENGRGADGAIKMYTEAKAPIYRRPPARPLVELLLARYYRPYHAALARAADRTRLGINCQTVAAPRRSKLWHSGEHPRACLGSGHGACPKHLVDAIAACLRMHLEVPIVIDHQYRGGYIARSRPGGIPWVELWLLRGRWLSNAEKCVAIREALRTLCLKKRVL